MIPKTHLDEYGEVLKVLEEAEAEIEARRSAAYKARLDRLYYLVERNFENIADPDKLPQSVFQDLDKFLAFFGVKDIYNAEDEGNQAFICDFFVETQAFWRKVRAVKRLALEWKVKTESLTLQYYYIEIAEKEKYLTLDPSQYQNEALQTQAKALKLMLTDLLAGLYSDVEELKQSIAMDRLRLMSFQEDISN